MTRAVILSDAHLGTPHARARSLLNFLRSLDRNAVLILNGDVVDSRPTVQGVEHEQVLTELREQSRWREVIWVRGNHDRQFRLRDPGRIRFAETQYEVGGVLVTHGADFFALRAHHRLFIAAIRMLYRVRLYCGTDRVHIAEFAKRYRWFYRVFRDRVRRHALAVARQNGYRAVCCGHTHYAEGVTAGNLQYWNTGCWTEGVAHCLWITDRDIRLEPWVCDARKESRFRAARFLAE